MKNYNKKMTKEQNVLFLDLDTIFDNPESDEEYFESNIKEFEAFYDAHIKGKAWEELCPGDWDIYSDWHKDLYGYRPHFV